MQGLKDIKGIVEVHGYSSIYLIVTIFVICLIVTAFVFAGYRYLKKKRRRKRKTKMQIAREKLKNLRFDNPKEAVYTFSEYANIITQNKEQQRENLENILKEIEIYKYKRDIPPLSKEVINKMKRFIKAL